MAVIEFLLWRGARQCSGMSKRLKIETPPFLRVYYIYTLLYLL